MVVVALEAAASRPYLWTLSWYAAAVLRAAVHARRALFAEPMVKATRSDSDPEGKCILAYGYTRKIGRAHV